MKKICLFVLVLSFTMISSNVLYAEDVKTLKNENARLNAELENLKLDRNNLVKQASMFKEEKEELLSKIQSIEGSTEGADVQIDSLKQENEILKSEVEKLKAARNKDRELHSEQKDAMQENINALTAQADSLTMKMEEFSPDKIDELVADRNRLEEESKRLTQKVFEHEKVVEEMKAKVTPLELDREELHRLRKENQQLYKRVGYVDKLEERQEQLINENAQYREELEVMKGKFKEAVPGLAKASRISQKMMKENADMHYNLGTIFLHNKKYRESIKEYERVLELRPNDPDTHYNLGILYDDYLKDREKALYHFQKYLAINPKAPDAKRVESYLLSLELEQKVR